MRSHRSKRRRLASPLKQACPSTTEPHPQWIAMSTRSRQPNIPELPDGSAPTLPKSSSVRCYWTSGDEKVLVTFLLERKSEAGDGFNFKAATWTAAAAHMVNYTTKGNPKTAAACKTKWGQIKETHRTVTDIKNLSGVSWNDESGVGVTPGMSSVWDDYTGKHKNAAQFAKKGWPLYEEVSAILPGLSKGRNTYQGRSKTATPGPSTPATSSVTQQASLLHTPIPSGSLTSPPPSPLDIAGFDAFDTSLVSNFNMTGEIGTGADVEPPTSPPTSLLESTSQASPAIFKRKFSALQAEESTPSSSPRAPPSVISRSASSGRRKPGVAEWNSISEHLASLANTFQADSEQEKIRHQERQERRAARHAQSHDDPPAAVAATHLLDLEEQNPRLSATQLAALLKIFEKNECSARMYLTVCKKGSDSVRDAWIAQTLSKSSSKQTQDMTQL